MDKKYRYSVLLDILSKVTFIVSLLLIWWGATVTSRNYGMAVPDWPLSFEKINPPGWVQRIDVFWEHSHRILGMSVGILVAIYTIIVWKKYSKISWLEFIIFFISLALVVDLSRKYGASMDKQSVFITLAVPIMIINLASFLWWMVSSFYRRWSYIVTLSILALFLVTNQAVIGGLRVTKISDSWAVFHGVLAQFFFCLILVLAIISGKGWFRPRKYGLEFPLKNYRKKSSILLVMVVLQLLLGSMMRHFHRVGLPVNPEFPLINGNLFPSTWNFDITVHFLHRTWAYFIVIYAIFFFIFAFRNREHLSGLFIYNILLIIFITMQALFGIAVVLSNKESYITTNLHVIFGLITLSLCSLSVFYSFVMRTRSRLLA